MTTDNLEERIDTNKKNGMEVQEIINFLKNDENVQELGKRLDKSLNPSQIDQQKNQKFYDAVYNATLNNSEFQDKIQNIINKDVGGLTDSDVFMLYLQSLVDTFGNSGNKLFTTKSGDIYTRYGGQGLLNYIRTKYKNPKYEFWKGWPNIIPQSTTQSTSSKKIEKVSKEDPQLPNDIDLSTFGENNTHMPKEFNKLDTWAKNNFSSEYNNEKNASKKRNAEKGDKINDYVQYDLIIFSLKKYQEHIEKKNNGIINGIYGNEQQCKFQQNLAKLYFEDLEKIDNEFPDIQEIIKKITGYFKDLEELQKKYLGNQKEEIIQKKYESYLKEIDNKGKELGINEQEIPKEITGFEDVVKILENTEKIAKFQESQEEIKNKYGKSSIDNYEKYINEKGNLIKIHRKDNLQKRIDMYKKYGEKVNECKNIHKQKGFDEKKYNEYIKKISKSDIPRHMENIQILYDSINIKDGKVPENFPIRSIKEDYEQIQKEQEETDKRRENLKNKSRLLYQICNIGSRGINALVSSTRGTGAKLGALVSSLWHDDDEMIAVWERANNGFWNPNIPISTRQSQSAYENGEIILNWDNGPGIVSEGIVNMLTLVAGGGAITKGLAKGATKIGVNMGTKLARGAGLVSSGFIQQAGPSFGEGLSAGMTGNQAMLYAITSATLQGSLELISPNEFINGLGKNLAKTYIKEILKSESKQSLKAIGIIFMKNVGSEIGEEIFQEEVQLAAGNLVNMWANDQYDLGINGLNTDRNPKNFAATALVTALTTGFVAGGGFAMQTPGMGNTQNRTQLIEEIKNNTELRSDVMNVLDKAIDGKIKIPNVNIQQQQDLKLVLNNINNDNIDIQNEITNNEQNEFNEIDFNQEEINQSNSKKTDDSEIKANEEINNEELTEFLNKIKESYRQEAGEELELTDEQTENIKRIKELGVEITIRDIIKIKELNKEWINEYITKGLKESINKIKNELGIKVYYQDIESLKDIELTENQINNIKKILDVIGTNIFARDILILKDIELTDEQIENIKKIKELGIEIYPMNIESLKDITKEQIENVNKIKNEYGIETYVWQIESIKNTKLTKEQIENIKIINNEILTLSASDIEPLKDITREQIENVKKIKELGIKIYISKEIESLKDITKEQIENIKRIKELGIKVEMDDIESIKDIQLTENQIESINKIKNEFGSDLSLNDIKIIDNNKEIFEINNDDFYKGYNYDKEGIEAHKEIIRGKIIDGIQQYIQKVIPENRDIGETEILEKVRLSIITLPKSERLGFLNKISDLVKKFNNVRKYLDFENGPYKSPEELFCAAYKPGLFNFIDINKYRGKVRVIQHGSGMVFYIGDSPILNSLYGKLWSNGNIFNKYTSSGFNSIESKIPELEGTISIVAGSQKNDFFGTTIHEGQHNRNTDFMPDKNQGPITYSKDEILAYLKCNTPIPIIKYNLCTPGGYQYGLKGEKREAHKKQVRQLCSYAEDLIKLTKDSNTTGLTRDKVISMLSDTPADKWEELHSNIMESIKLHSQENSTQETVKNLRQRFISKIKERARNYRLVENLTNYRNFLFPNYKIDLEKPEFWRAGTAKIETAINEIKSCNTLEEIKHILNDPKYSHIGRGPNNKGGMEISAIIDKVIAGRQKIDNIPEEIRPYIENIIGKQKVGTDVYIKLKEGLETKAKVESYDSATKEYTVIYEENGIAVRKRVTAENLKDITQEISRAQIEGERKREPTELRNIKEIEFQDVSNETLTEMGNDLRDTFGSTNYDSFDLYLNLIRNKKTGESLRDSFRTLDLSSIDTSRGTICTGMARLLQAKLSQKGINSHMIRFEAGGTKNNEYLGDGHTALIVPRRMENGSLEYTLLDPGLMVSEPLTFGKRENNPKVPPGDNPKYQIKYTGNTEYPFTMIIYKRNAETGKIEIDKELPFNPDQERINPEQTLNIEILRVFTDFKISKINSNGKNQGLIRLNLPNNKDPYPSIELRRRGEDGKMHVFKEKKLSIDEFKNLKNNLGYGNPDGNPGNSSPKYGDFLKACEALGRDPDIMYDELMLGIENLDEYISTIQNISSDKQ